MTSNKEKICNTKATPIPCLCDLPIPVFVEQELSGLTRRVNDERVAVETLDHDGILGTKVISRQRVGLPLETVVSAGEILRKKKLANCVIHEKFGAKSFLKLLTTMDTDDSHPATHFTQNANFIIEYTYLYSGQVCSEGDVCLLHVRGPGGEQVVAELLVKVPSIRHER